MVLLYFGKVLIARRATTFAKVDYSDNQSLLKITYFPLTSYFLPLTCFED